MLDKSKKLSYAQSRLDASLFTAGIQTLPCPVDSADLNTTIRCITHSFSEKEIHIKILLSGRF